MRCTAFSGVRRDFIGIHPQTLYKGIFAGLLRFRHIIQFSPPSIIHIIQHNSFHVKYCHFSVLLLSLFSEKHIHQYHKPRHQLSQHLPTFQQLPGCENFNKLLLPPGTHTPTTHTTRAGKDSQ